MSFKEFRTWLDRNPFIRTLILEAINPGTWIIDEGKIPKEIMEQWNIFEVKVGSKRTVKYRGRKDCLAYTLLVNAGMESCRWGILVFPDLSEIKAEDDYLPQHANKKEEEEELTDETRVRGVFWFDHKEKAMKDRNYWKQF